MVDCPLLVGDASWQFVLTRMARDDRASMLFMMGVASAPMPAHYL